MRSAWYHGATTKEIHVLSLNDANIRRKKILFLVMFVCPVYLPSKPSRANLPVYQVTFICRTITHSCCLSCTCRVNLRRVCNKHALSVIRLSGLQLGQLLVFSLFSGIQRYLMSRKTHRNATPFHHKSHNSYIQTVRMSIFSTYFTEILALSIKAIDVLQTSQLVEFDESWSLRQTQELFAVMNTECLQIDKTLLLAGK